MLDSGLTLKFARDLMLSRGAQRAAIAAMVNKPEGRRAEIEADYVGFTCPNYFVVGYGMDAAHAWRELPYVGVFEFDAERSRVREKVMRILLTEDDNSVRAFVSRALELDGHNVATACHGVEALERLTEKRRRVRSSRHRREDADHGRHRARA